MSLCKFLCKYVMSMLCVKKGSKEVQKAPRELYHIGDNVDDQTVLSGIFLL